MLPEGGSKIVYYPQPRTIRCVASPEPNGAGQPDAMFFVYVLRNPAGRLYIGFTSNMSNRVLYHNHEAYISEIDARRREKYQKTTKGWTTLKTMLAATLSMADGAAENRSTPDDNASMPKTQEADG